jgi:hypothetical protein
VSEDALTDGRGLTRRSLLKGAAAMSLAGALPGAAAGAATRRPGVLPTAAEVRADIQRMVDFGPRLTGSDAHNRFVAWLEREFTSAGCQLLPCDVYQTSRWLADRFGLDLLGGPGAGPARVATYFPRSQQTPPGGVTGPLVYGGVAPALSMNGTDTRALIAAIKRYPQDMRTWAHGVSGLLGADARGSVMLVDLPMPPPLTPGGLFGADMTFYNGQGETLTNESVPALYVDRDTGAALRQYAATRPSTRLTLTATREEVPTPAVTAVLPGVSEETLIFDTHTDGQGFVEENGGVALLHLARYFAALPARKRLKRTLVFACWPGHMSNDLPQATGWIDSHQDLVKRAAAAFTVEHLGCTEWNDSLAQGYHPTGRAEIYAVWTTQGKMFELTRDTVVAHNLPRTALMRPPTQFGVGGPFQTAGVPQIGGLAGPNYLITVSDNGDMDKLDAGLAARQIAWLADLATRVDSVPAAELRQGDPTLGKPSFTGNIAPSSATPTEEACGPAVKHSAPAHASMTMHYYGRRRGIHGLLVVLSAHGGRFTDVTVELRRAGRVLARGQATSVGPGARRVVLHALPGRRVSPGRSTLIARHGGRVLATRTVHVD